MDANPGAMGEREGTRSSSRAVLRQPAGPGAGRRAADMVPPARTAKAGGVTWHGLRRLGRERRYEHIG
jgi:hypothetical protein